MTALPPSRQQHSAAIIRRIAMLRENSEILLQHADLLEKNQAACAASDNLDGASTWHRLANLARSEADWSRFRATVLEDSTKHFQESKKCA